MTACVANGHSTVLQKKLDEAVVPMGEYELKFEYNELGPEFEEKARKELRETQDIVAEAIINFKKLIQDEPNFYYPLEDNELKVYLRPCKFYPESAMDKMRKYYKYKLKHPKYYHDLVPSSEVAAFKQSIPTILPHRTKNGERILVVECGGKWSPKTCTLTNIVRSVILILEAALSEPRTQVAGAHVLLDMEGLSMTHVWQFTPSFASDLVELVQDCIPLRLKGVHVVNQPYIFNMLYAIFKPFLNEKIRGRIHFYGTNYTSLHKALGKSVLPLKYEGSLQIPMDEGEKLHSFISIFEEELSEKMQQGYKNEQKK